MCNKGGKIRAGGIVRINYLVYRFDDNILDQWVFQIVRFFVTQILCDDRHFHTQHKFTATLFKKLTMK